MQKNIKSLEIDSYIKDDNPDYSICTLVTNKQQYIDMLESIKNAGFTEERCEFLYIDNTEKNKYDAYSGVKQFFNIAKGKYIILCHQDLVFHKDKIDKLDNVIEEISRKDPNWALLGNAGGTVPGQQAYLLTEFDGNHLERGKLPFKVNSLDENFILVKKSANIGISNDLHGFHMYGTDLCMIANILGYACYVVDFHLWHLGGASTEAPKIKGQHATNTFDTMRKKIIDKYQRVFSPRFIQTTCTIFYVSNSKIKNFLFNNKHIFSIQKRKNKWFK